MLTTAARHEWPVEASRACTGVEPPASLSGSRTAVFGAMLSAPSARIPAASVELITRQPRGRAGSLRGQAMAGGVSNPQRGPGARAKLRSSVATLDPRDSASAMYQAS